VVLVSFGYLHGPAPEAHVTVDVRESLYDPRIDPGMRELTGSDARVAHRVMVRIAGRQVEVEHRTCIAAASLALLARAGVR
jgi:RNase adaptor protein for sRNA GlmZ degradation